MSLTDTQMALEYKPKANVTWVDQKQDGEINSIFKIEFSQDRTQLSYVYLRS
jgi:hypothetical protein